MLGRVPRVTAATEPQPGPAVSLALAVPPRVTQLTVSPPVLPADPDTEARIDSPFVLTADPSGLFLVIAPPSVSERPPTEARVWCDPDGVEHTFHVGRISSPAYLVLDVPSGTASRVPDPDVLNASSVGLIASPGGHGYMFVEFQNMVGSKKATLICFSSETGKWGRVHVNNPLPRWIWTFADVITHDGKLWWVDRAAGLLASDPFADKPEMAYIPLPKVRSHGGGCRSCSYCSERNSTSGRCVQVSNGKFRCVDMSFPSQGGAPKLTMHTLADPETAEWTPEHRVSFDKIWADDSYEAAGLQKKPLVVAFIHPETADVVYFRREVPLRRQHAY